MKNHTPTQAQKTTAWKRMTARVAARQKFAQMTTAEQWASLNAQRAAQPTKSVTLSAQDLAVKAEREAREAAQPKMQTTPCQDGGAHAYTTFRNYGAIYKVDSVDSSVIRPIKTTCIQTNAPEIFEGVLFRHA